MFESGVEFTSPVRQAMQEARWEASRLGHRAVDTEHLLFGLLADPSEDILSILQASGQTRDVVIASLVPALRPAVGAPSSAPDLPFAETYRRVLGQALMHARSPHHPEIGPGHMILALALEPATGGGRVLVNLGITPQLVRDALEVYYGAPDR